MKYSLYFKAGQKIQLRRLDAEAPGGGSFEALNVVLEEIGPDYFDLSLPYRIKEGEDYPFAPAMPFELRAVAMGMGMRISGSFRESLDEHRIRVALGVDLQAFQPRPGKRIDARVGLRFTRGQGNLRSLRELWDKNVRVLQSGRDLSKLQSSFSPCQVNLSAGGLRFDSPTPVELAELCLFLIDLQDGQPPICTLAEVIWTSEKEGAKGYKVGMQFLNILEADQKRIEGMIRAREVEERKKAKP